MVKQNDNIFEKIRREGLAKPSAGMKVPEGYFESFAARMETTLPQRPEIESTQMPAPPRTTWQKIRPYAYMAAMFAGIWLMLQMFAMMSRTNTLKPIEQNTVIANALTTDDFVNQYIYEDMSSWDLVDDMLDEGEIDENSEILDFTPEEAAFDSTYILP